MNTENTIEGIARLPKEYINHPPKYTFVLQDIAEIMIELDMKDVFLIKLPDYEGELEERKQLIKQCIDIITNECGNDCVILIDSFVSHREYPRSKYTLYETMEKEKEVIPVKNILKRESEMFTELGFININDYIEYAYKEAFVYGNSNGKLIRGYIDKFMTTR